MQKSKKFIIEDKQGNNMYPATFADVVFTEDGGNVAEKLKQIEGATPNAHTHTKSQITDFAHTHTKSEISDFPTSLPANGGNADTVDGKHASDFPLKSQGIGGNAPIWNGSNLNDLPIGVYTTKVTGVPEVDTYHMVMCMYNDVGASKLQIALSQGHSGGANDRRGRTYIRSCVQGMWSGWSPTDGVSLGYSDARGDGNKQPIWYVNNKRTGMTLELNSGTNNGMPSTALYHVITTLPWNDTTGGVIQTAINVNTGQQYIRNSASDTTWSAWKSLGEGGGLEISKYKQVISVEVADGVAKGTVLASSATGLDILAFRSRITNSGLNLMIENGGKVYVISAIQTMSDYPNAIRIYKPYEEGSMAMPICFTGNTVVKVYSNYATSGVTIGLK